MVDLLSSSERARSEGLTFAELRPALGKDRSNARRALDSLIGRGDLERVTNAETTEEPRYKLSWLACVSAMMRAEPLADEPDPLGEAREHRREADAALDEIRARRGEERRALAAREDLWEEPARPSSHPRPPGPNQRRVIAVLVRYAPDPQMGLPEGAVRQIACAGEAVEKANVLRAVRSLIHSGLLQRSRDGERLRLDSWWFPLRWRATPYTLDPPLDDEKAEAVIEAFGESGGVSPQGSTPCLAEKIPEPG